MKVARQRPDALLAQQRRGVPLAGMAQEKRPSNSPGSFARMAMAVSRISGRPPVFATAVVLVVLWAVSGPAFGFSETWQLVINTGTTVVTFLMVFLIQATQYRDNEALQLKLDELIEATENAHEDMIDLEEQSDEVIERKRVEMRLRRDAGEARPDH